MGWAAGLQSGMALGNLINQGFDRRELAEEAKKHRIEEVVPEQARVQDLVSQRDAAAQGLMAQGMDSNQAYQQATQEMLPQFQSTAQDVGAGRQYTYGGQTFTDRGEAERALSAGRTQGLANVYRSQGDEEKASALEARAMQNRAAGLQINKLQREEDAETRYANFGQFAAQNPDMTAAQLKEAALKQFKFTPEQWEKAVTTRLNIDKADLETFKTGVAKKMQGKSLAQLGSLYNTDPDFDDKTDLAIVPGKGGAVTLSFVDKASGKTISSQSFNNEALAVEYLHTQAKQPELLGTWMLGMQTKEQQIAASKASVRASDAAAGLSSERLTNLKTERENREEAAKLESQYSALTDAEKAGPKGQGLIRQFNMINVKAGGQISLGPQARPGQTMTDLEKENLRAYRKWEEDDRNARLSQAEKDKKATSMGVYQFVNPTANTVETGLGSNPYANTGGKAGQGEVKPQGVQTRTPAINSTNTRIVSKAGNMGYNVELPDGSVRTMEQDELEDLGYKFPTGSGLSRPWYADLMPRR